MRTQALVATVHSVGISLSWVGMVSSIFKDLFTCMIGVRFVELSRDDSLRFHWPRRDRRGVVEWTSNLGAVPLQGCPVISSYTMLLPIGSSQTANPCGLVHLLVFGLFCVGVIVRATERSRNRPSVGECERLIGKTIDWVRE